MVNECDGVYMCVRLMGSWSEPNPPPVVTQYTTQPLSLPHLVVPRRRHHRAHRTAAAPWTTPTTLTMPTIPNIPTPIPRRLLFPPSVGIIPGPCGRVVVDSLLVVILLLVVVVRAWDVYAWMEYKCV